MPDFNANSQAKASDGTDRRANTRAKIVQAAFEVFGEEDGLYTRIEDVASRAGVTRTTFYNHFSGMIELRDAVTYEVTHDFLEVLNKTIDSVADPRVKASAAIRCFLYHARADRRWAWSLLNMSANGITFGLETYRQCTQSIADGIAEGYYTISSSSLGRDLVLGTTLAGIATQLRETVPEDYPEEIAFRVLVALGVPNAEARAFAYFPVPLLKHIEPPGRRRPGVANARGLKSARARP